jgi:hypothetical protein
LLDAFKALTTSLVRRNHAYPKDSFENKFVTGKE